MCVGHCFLNEIDTDVETIVMKETQRTRNIFSVWLCNLRTKPEVKKLCNVRVMSISKNIILDETIIISFINAIVRNYNFLFRFVTRNKQRRDEHWNEEEQEL